MEATTLKPIPLKNLKPKGAVLTIDGKDHKLRPVNLDDWVWMAETLNTDDPAVQISQGMPLKDMVRIIYRLLIDKSDFKAETIKEFIDDEGECHGEVRISGPDKLRKAITGVDGISQLTDAFTKCLGLSEATPEQLKEMEKAGAQKKTTRKTRKKGK
jgi:hypothetical protein